MDTNLDNLQHLMALNQETRFIEQNTFINTHGALVDKDHSLIIVIVNQKLTSKIKNTRVCRGSKIYSDHHFFISKIMLWTRWRKIKRKEREHM
jgi:hypothetical protein